MSDSVITENFESSFPHRVLNWFDQHGRKDLPWQKELTSYRVWISEIMLQQTQVNTVIPYFEAFMKRFPDIQNLAQANIDEVLGLWSGLGYYARARNLHLTAKRIVEENAGLFPDNLEGLMKLPGIGKSTAGAILAISQRKKAAILDGNVRRVLCRFHAVEGFPGDLKVQKRLWVLAEQYTPEERVAEYTQAMMDLGAIVCKKTSPDCLSCPLSQGCVAYQEGKVKNYPYSKPKKAQPVKKVYMLILQFKEKLFLYKRPEIGLWGGLWSFPEFSDILQLKHFCMRQGHFETIEYSELYRHTFTHFHLDITPIYVQLSGKLLQVMEVLDHAWCDMEKLGQIGVPIVVKKLLKKRESYVQRDLLY